MDMKEEIVEVKHIKDIIKLKNVWHDYANKYSREGIFYSIYESESEIFTVNYKGKIIKIEEKINEIIGGIIMHKILEIYVSDLKPEALTKLLEFYEVSSVEELNYDITPVFILEK